MTFLVRLLALGTILLFAKPTLAALPQTPADLFSGTNIWSVHLKFTQQQWQAMEPRQTGNGLFRGGRGGFGGPATSALLAPAFLKDGDQNEDGNLSRDEFATLHRLWFSNWDKSKSGILTSEQLREGLAAVLQSAGGVRPARTGLQGPEGKRNGVASRSGYEFDYVRGDLEFEGKSLTNIAARYKGNGSFLRSQRASGKRSLKVDLNKFVKGQKIAGVSTLNFHSNILDPSWMHESVAYRLYREAGLPAPTTAYARLKISAGNEHKNEYFGLFSMVENIDENFAEKYFGVKGGAIFKPVTPDLFADLGNNWANYQQTYDPKTDLTPGQSARVMEMCRFVSTASDGEFSERLGQFIDLDAFARYLAVTVWVVDLDGILGPGQNYYLYLHPKTKKFHFIAWDQDNSFGQMRGTQEEREQLAMFHPWTGDNRFLERVFKVEIFKRIYRARMAEFASTIFNVERFYADVDHLGKILRAAVAEESEDKALNFDEAVAGRIPRDMGYRPGGGNKPIKGFVAARAPAIIDQLAGKTDGLRIEGRGFGGGGRGFGGDPGIFLAGAFLGALDADRDGEISRVESRQGFARWFENWNADKNGVLTAEELRAGIAEDLTPFFGR